MGTLKRIFIGIKADPQLQRTIGNWSRPYKHLELRWTPSADLHLTLIPPSQVSDVKTVVAAIKTASEPIPAFELLVKTIEFGPHPRHPRLIWAVCDIPPIILKLHETLQIALDKSEIRPYKPHVTIAKFKANEFSRIPIQNLNETLNHVWSIKSVDLFEVKPTEVGRYHIIESILLSTKEGPPH